MMMYATALISAVLALYLGWPCPFEPDEFTLPEPPTLDGVYHPEHCKAKRQGRLKFSLPEVVGPESMVFDSQGRLYAGSRYGAIWKVTSASKPPVLLARTGTRRCERNEEGKECGRPLGMRMLDDKTLLVVDLHGGLLSVDTTTGSMKLLLGDGDSVEGHDVSLLNDLDLDTVTGMVYISQMSRRWRIEQLEYDVVEGKCSGRMISYHLATGVAQLLADGLCFPNGVQLSADRKKVVFAETSRYQLSEILLEGSTSTSTPAVVTKVVLDESTAGYPDNLRSHPAGGYLLAVPTLRAPAKQAEVISRWPMVRRAMWKLTPMFVYTIVQDFLMYGMCVHYHANGTVLETFHFPDFPGFKGISQCTVAPDSRTMYVVSRSESSVLAVPIV